MQVLIKMFLIWFSSLRTPLHKMSAQKDISHLICSLKPIFWEVWDFGSQTRAVQWSMPALYPPLFSRLLLLKTKRLEHNFSKKSSAQKDISHLISSLKPIFWEVWDFGSPMKAAQWSMPAWRPPTTGPPWACQPPSSLCPLPPGRVR